MLCKSLRNVKKSLALNMLETMFCIIEIELGHETLCKILLRVRIISCKLAKNFFVRKAIYLQSTTFKTFFYALLFTVLQLLRRKNILFMPHKVTSLPPPFPIQQYYLSPIQFLSKSFIMFSVSDPKPCQEDRYRMTTKYKFLCLL